MRDKRRMRGIVAILHTDACRNCPAVSPEGAHRPVLGRDDSIDKNRPKTTNPAMAVAINIGNLRSSERVIGNSGAKLNRKNRGSGSIPGHSPAGAGGIREHGQKQAENHQPRDQNRNPERHGHFLLTLFGAGCGLKVSKFCNFFRETGSRSGVIGFPYASGVGVWQNGS